MRVLCFSLLSHQTGGILWSFSHQNHKITMVSFQKFQPGWKQWLYPKPWKVRIFYYKNEKTWIKKWSRKISLKIVEKSWFFGKKSTPKFKKLIRFAFIITHVNPKWRPKRLKKTSKKTHFFKNWVSELYILGCREPLIFCFLRNLTLKLLEVCIDFQKPDI